MPPIFDTSATPWITSTSPVCARLCASNSAIRLTCWRAPSIGLMRWMMLRTVSAGPAMVRPGMVGLSTDAPMTPHGMPSSSIVSEMIPVASPSAIRRSIAPCGGRGTAISLMFSAAMRPVNRLFSATYTRAPANAALPHPLYIHLMRRKRSGGRVGITPATGALAIEVRAQCPPYRSARGALAPEAAARYRCRLSAQREGNRHDRSLRAHQPQRAENLHHARGMRAALQGTLRRCLEGRAVHVGICEDQPQQQDPRDRRSRRAGRQALSRDRIRRDPHLPRREDRKVFAQGHGQEIRRAAMADDPAHWGRADVRPMDPLQAVRAQVQRRLFDGPLHLGNKAPLRGAGDAARQSAVSRRAGVFGR